MHSSLAAEPSLSDALPARTLDHALDDPTKVSRREALRALHRNLAMAEQNVHDLVRSRLG